MPRSKYGPALFEVYTKNRPEDVEHDPLMNEVVRTRRTPAAESVSAFRATLASLVRAISAAANRGSSDAGERSMQVAQPVALDGGRVHFSLSSRGAGIVAFGLLLAASVCFLAGRWVGWNSGLADGRKIEQQAIQGSALDEIAQARQSAPVDGLFDDLPSSPVARGEPAAPAAVAPRQPQPPATLAATRPSAPTWVKGNTYVIVQEFGVGATEDAKKAGEFLAQNGIDAVVVNNGGKPRLIATRGFNTKDETQNVLLERFLTQLRSVGESYRKAGGQYRLQGYTAKLTSDSW